MSKPNERATSVELAAEFERAMGSLATTPVKSASVSRVFDDIRDLCDEAMGNPYDHGTDIDLAIMMERIAAIALEGAARLRRGT